MRQCRIQMKDLQEMEAKRVSMFIEAQLEKAGFDLAKSIDRKYISVERVMLYSQQKTQNGRALEVII